MPFPPDNVDSARGLTASQAAGLTLAAARAIVAAVQREARRMQVALTGAVGVSGGDSLQDQAAVDAAVRAFEAGPSPA